MSKRSEKTSPSTPGSKDGQLVNSNSTCNQKNPVYEIQYEVYLGEQIPYVLIDAKKRYPVNAVGRILGYGPKDEFKLYRAHEKILAQFAISAVVSGDCKLKSVPCIDSVGLLIMTGKAPLGNMPEQRQIVVMKIVQFMAESGDMRLKGELISKNEVEGMFDTATLKDNPKAITKDNGFRRAFFVEKVRATHPESPNTYKRLHDLAHNDQALILGPIVPFESGKHLKYSKELTVKDHAQKMASFAAIVAGNIEIDAINRFEKNLFKGLPEKYIPDYLSTQLETTKQLSLIGGEEA